MRLERRKFLKVLSVIPFLSFGRIGEEEPIKGIRGVYGMWVPDKNFKKPRKIIVPLISDSREIKLNWDI